MTVSIWQPFLQKNLKASTRYYANEKIYNGLNTRRKKLYGQQKRGMRHTAYIERVIRGDIIGPLSQFSYKAGY